MFTQDVQKSRNLGFTWEDDVFERNVSDKSCMISRGT